MSNTTTTYSTSTDTGWIALLSDMEIEPLDDQGDSWSVCFRDERYGTLTEFGPDGWTCIPEDGPTFSGEYNRTDSASMFVTFRHGEDFTI
jgi:hypothetical protein